jgi:hypothetical protein
LESLNSSYTRIETVGVVDDYPLHRVSLEDGLGVKKNILITGGIHGDEPAGPASVLRFLERDNTHLLQCFKFLILPCINPYGYVHNTRKNKRDLDLNRLFEETGIAEVDIVKETIEGQRFHFCIDFHEDWEAEGVYLYEAQRNERWIGPEITRQIEKIGRIDGEVGESDLPIADGVFQVDPAWGDAGLAPYLFHFSADHVMICETPTSWHLDQRTAAHLAALDAALKALG